MTLIITGTCKCPDLEHQILDKHWHDLYMAPCPKCQDVIFWHYD